MKTKNTDFSSLTCGFIAGTLVHTKEGLRPIEQISIGDWVLSKSLNDDDYVEYKKVIRIETRQSPINYFTYQAKTLAGEAVQGTLIVAPQHLVWSGVGSWREFGNLTKMSSNTRLHGDKVLEAFSSRTLKLYISATPSVVWLPCYNLLDALGAFFDLQHFVFIQNPETGTRKEDFFGLDLGRPRKRPQPKDLYHATVYDLGVEDYQTCCVGNPGIWVAASAGEALHYAPERAPRKNKSTEPARLSIFEPPPAMALPETFAQAIEAFADISHPGDRSKLEAFGAQLAQSLSCCVEPGDTQRSIWTVRLPENDIPFTRLTVLELAAAAGLVVTDFARGKIWLPTGLVLSQGQENAWRYTTQRILPRKKCSLSCTEYKEVVTAHLMKILLPLGFEKVTDRKIKEDRDFYFSRPTEIGSQFVSGHISQIYQCPRLWLNSGGYVEDVRQVLEPALTNDPSYETHLRYVLGYYGFPVVFEVTGDQKHRLNTSVDFETLEQLEAVLDRLESFLPKLLQQGQTVAGLDSILNGTEEFRSDWAMAQRDVRKRNYFSLGINALGNDKQLDAIAEKYREIIKAPAEDFGVHHASFTLENVDRLLKHLHSIAH